MQTALLVAPARDMDRGVAWLHLGKQQLFSSMGSRNLIVKPLFDLYALYQWLVSAHESENVFGKDQQDWLMQTLTDSKTTYRVIGSSVMPTEGVLNLTTIPGIPASFQQVFLYGIDGWDGFPNKRQELIDFLKNSGITNTFFVAGDIHGGFVSELGGDTAVSITTPAISSGTLQESVRDAALGLGFTIDSPGYKAVVANLDQTLRDSNPAIRFSAPDQHGFVMVEVGASSAKVTFHLINQSEVTMDSTGLGAAALAAKFSTKQFQIIGGTVTAL
jgi:alkaline phosphatase D